ncbi:MAG TPA: PKD domain-containing protein [Vicinamibacterales bacterium]|nr:PKD domain-containing protein [Vicinamibacterales bacterium]
MTRRFIVLAAVLAIAGCTLDKQAAPPLAGPSSFALSLQISASPDILSQDGHSQSSIDIVARDANSQPVRGLTLKIDTTVGGSVVSFGTLSAGTVSTNGDGRASVVYQAPPPPPLTAPDSTVVTLLVTPVGTNFDNTTSFGHTVSINLVRPGAPLGPAGDMQAVFSLSPTSPKEGDSVQFDASGSKGNIVSYSWDFGDGRTATGVKTSHSYGLAGTYNVTLTVKDDRGLTTSSTQSLSVGGTAAPTVDFSVSPSTPIAGTVVFFNASASHAATGHNIVDYAWDFGDGTSGSGVNPTHTFALPQGYNVTLVVTDDIGRTASVTKTVSAATSNPKADFSVQPQAPHTTDIITLDASASSAVLGRNIVTYSWAFSGVATGTALGQSVTVGPLPAGTLTIKLTVTDSAGQTGIITKNVIIQP